MGRSSDTDQGITRSLRNGSFQTRSQLLSQDDRKPPAGKGLTGGAHRVCGHWWIPKVSSIIRFILVEREVMRNTAVMYGMTLRTSRFPNFERCNGGYTNCALPWTLRFPFAAALLQLTLAKKYRSNSVRATRREGLRGSMVRTSIINKNTSPGVQSEETLAANKIQAMVRGIQGRKRCVLYHESRRESSGATNKHKPCAHSTWIHSAHG